MSDLQKDLLSRWINKNRSNSHEKHIGENMDSSSMFLDCNGILRHKESWKVADNELNNLDQLPKEKKNDSFDYNHNAIKYHLQTGCKELIIDCDSNFMSQSIGVQQESKNLATFKFLLDWKLLWENIASDTEDEIAIFSPMLKIYIEFFFHKQTTNLIIYIALYIIFVYLLLIAIYRPKLWAIYYLFTLPVIGLIAHFTSRRLIHGKYRNKQQHIMTKNDKNNQVNYYIDDNQKTRNSINHLTPHWNLALLQLYRSASTECKANCFYYNRRSKRPTHNHKSEEKESFYQLMNISLKYLTRVCELKIEDATFNRPIYKYFLQSITFGLPFLLVYIIYISTLPELIFFCEGLSLDEILRTPACGMWLLEFILTFGYLTNIIFLYLYGGGVLLTLVALAYGAEIAYMLTDTWIDRFGSLRRISLPANDSNYNMPSTSSINQINNSKIIDLNNNNNLKSSLSSDKSTLNPLTSSKIKINEEVIEDQEDEESPVTPLIQNVHSVIDVIPYIERESFERYLFMRHYLNQASKIWSPLILALAVWFIYLVGIASLNLSTKVVLKNRYFGVSLAFFIWFLFIRFVIVLVLPILSITHANSHVSLLTESFFDASPDDFSILGGRDKWIEFIKSVPAVWTIYGIWITYDKFYATASAVLLTVIAYVLSYLSSTNSW
eukprot:gene5449-7542_t